MKFRSWVLTTTALATLATGISTAALAPERRLAGITLGSKGIVALKRYGNPSSVSPGLDDRSGFTTTNAAPTNPYATGPGGLPPGAPGGSGYPGGRPGGSGYPSGYPGAPGSGYPGARPGGSGYPGAPTSGSLPPAGVDAGGGGDTGVDNSGLVTWTYRKFKGTVVNFRLDEDGKIVEIVASGFRPSPLARTSRGINLGDPYGKVLRVYGFPDESVDQGNVMTIRYTRNGRVAFRFHRLRLVGIAVAQPKRASNAVL